MNKYMHLLWIVIAISNMIYYAIEMFNGGDTLAMTHYLVWIFIATYMSDKYDTRIGAEDV